MQAVYDVTANQQALIDAAVDKEGCDITAMLNLVADAQTALAGTDLHDRNPIVMACLKVVDAYGEEALNPSSVQRGKDLDAAVRHLKQEAARIK